MQILRDREVAFTPDVTVCRETRWGSLIAFVFLLSAVAGVAVFLTITGSWASPWAIAGFAIWAAIMALPIHLCLRTFRASRRPESWLFAWAQDRLYLRFRSYQNHRFDPETPSVVCIPRREIDWIRAYSQKLEAQDSDGDWNNVLDVKGLQIKLKRNLDPAPLSETLAEEAKRRDHKGIRFNHYPLTLGAESILRVEVRNPKTLLKQLAPFYTTTTGQDVPLKHFRDMTTDEKENHILDLVLAGQKIDAIKAARAVYGYDLAQAKKMVEGLTET
jgi:hypothetical protein